MVSREPYREKTNPSVFHLTQRIDKNLSSGVDYNFWSQNPTQIGIIPKFFYYSVGKAFGKLSDLYKESQANTLTLVSTKTFIRSSFYYEISYGVCECFVSNSAWNICRFQNSTLICSSNSVTNRELVQKKSQFVPLHHFHSNAANYQICYSN